MMRHPPFPPWPGARPRAHLLALIVLAAIPPRSVLAQAAGTSGPRSSRPAVTMSVKPTVSLGRTVLEWDYGGDDAFWGWSARGGVALGPLADVTLGVEHWPQLGPSARGWSYQAEVSIYPLGRGLVAPYVLFGLGHFSAIPPEGSSYERLSGHSTALAFGLDARLPAPLRVRLEGVARIDAGGGDDQLRAFLTYAPRAAGWDGASHHGEAAVYGMVRLSGPWHFVGPGYGLKLATGVSQDDALALTLILLHWQVPSSSGNGRYLWDTRAILLMPGWRRAVRAGKAEWYVQLGPALQMMIEGPDFGLRGGANAEIGGSVRLGSLPRMTGGIGWLWIVRGPGYLVSPTDERGLLLHAGIAF